MPTFTDYKLEEKHWEEDDLMDKHPHKAQRFVEKIIKASRRRAQGLINFFIWESQFDTQISPELAMAHSLNRLMVTVQDGDINIARAARDAAVELGIQDEHTLRLIVQKAVKDAMVLIAKARDSYLAAAA